MKKILALDPGQCTGFGLIESVKGAAPALLDYGIVPVIGQGLGALVASTKNWLDDYVGKHGLRGSDSDVVFEESICVYTLKTRSEGKEVRGVIRAWCEQNKPVDYVAYTPAAVRSQLDLPQKGTVKTYAKNFVELVFGQEFVAVPDHVTDALVVGLAHALREGLWTAKIGMRKVEARMQTRGVARRTSDGPVRMSAEQYQRLVKAGAIK